MTRKLSLFLMTSKGYAVLKSIVNQNLVQHIQHVIIGEDKNIANDYKYEIIDLCKRNKLNFYLKSDFEKLNNQDLDLALAISWRWLIKDNVEHLYIIHDSLLPKYRGFAPLVNQLINGEKEVGVTLIKGEATYDTGNIILQKKLEISYPIKIKKAIDLIEKLYGVLTCQFIQLIIEEADLQGVKQDQNNATYSLWRDEEDYFINWTHSSETIVRFINAVGYPYKGARSYLNKKDTIIIDDAEPYPDVKIVNRDIGKVIFVEDNLPIVVCGEGLLKIIKYRIAHESEEKHPFKRFRSRFT